MITEFEKLHTFMTQTRELWAVMIGMFIQYWFGEKKCHRVIVAIILSTLVVALYLVPMAIEILNMLLLKVASIEIKPDSKIAIALYATSTIISVDLLAIVINILPDGLSKQAKKFLGVSDV